MSLRFVLCYSMGVVNTTWFGGHFQVHCTIDIVCLHQVAYVFRFTGILLGLSSSSNECFDKLRWYYFFSCLLGYV